MSQHNHAAPANKDNEVTSAPLISPSPPKPEECPPVALVSPQGNVYLEPGWPVNDFEGSVKDEASKSLAARLVILWKTFADYTTLHGFRQIAEDTEFICRR